MTVTVNDDFAKQEKDLETDNGVVLSTLKSAECTNYQHWMGFINRARSGTKENKFQSIMKTITDMMTFIDNILNAKLTTNTVLQNPTFILQGMEMDTKKIITSMRFFVQLLRAKFEALIQNAKQTLDKLKNDLQGMKNAETLKDKISHTDKEKDALLKEFDKTRPYLASKLLDMQAVTFSDAFNVEEIEPLVIDIFNDKDVSDYWVDDGGGKSNDRLKVPKGAYLYNRDMELVEKVDPRCVQACRVLRRLVPLIQMLMSGTALKDHHAYEFAQNAASKMCYFNTCNEILMKKFHQISERKRMLKAPRTQAVENTPLNGRMSESEFVNEFEKMYKNIVGAKLNKINDVEALNQLLSDVGKARNMLVSIQRRTSSSFVNIFRRLTSCKATQQPWTNRLSR